MATKEKKTPLNKKETTTDPLDTEQKPAKAKVPRKPRKIGPKGTPKNVVVRKTRLGINLKAKAKKPNQLGKKLAKTVLKNAKTVEAKTKILKNGVKEVKKPRRKAIKKDPEEEKIPTETPDVEKKQPKKRLTKKALKLQADLENKKIKIETDDSLSVASDLTDASFLDTPRPASRARGRKIKTEPTETIEDVMNDLSSLIKTEDIKKENDSMSESSKSDIIKPKKMTKKRRLDLLKKCIKKETLENNLNIIEQQKVIDMLDLNVANKISIKRNTLMKQRRHSIEKFPIGSLDSPLSLFSQLPRSMSPRSKRSTRGRQNSDAGRRSNPYATRSDSPARILRNGKSRKVKDHLLHGLETKKRRRLHSDVSKYEYESDSSFSDMASLTGTDASDVKDMDDQKGELIHPAAIKRTPSTDVVLNDNPITDTNSNLFNKSNALDINLNDKIKAEKMDETELKSVVDKCSKVPEKSLILDIMKQTFNDKPPEAKTMLTSTFYGKSKQTIETAPKVAENKSEKIKEGKESYIFEENEANEIDVFEEKEVMNKINELIAQEMVVNNIKDDDESEMVETEEKEEELDDDEYEIVETEQKEEELDNGESEIVENEQREEELEMDEEIVEKEESKTLEEKEELQAVEDKLKVVVEKEMVESQNETEEVVEEKMEVEESINDEEQNYDNTAEQEKIIKKTVEDENTIEETVEDENVTEETVEEAVEEENVTEETVEEAVQDENVTEETVKEAVDDENVTEETVQETVAEKEHEKQEANNVQEEIETDEKEEDINVDNKNEKQTNVSEEKEISFEFQLTETESQEMDVSEEPTEKDPLAEEEEQISSTILHDENSEVNKENASTNTSINQSQILTELVTLDETEEEKAEKERILKALGLQSLQAAAEAKELKDKVVGGVGGKSDNYTGTLKTVIKLPRGDKKKRNSLKLTLQKHKVREGDQNLVGNEDGYKIMKESTSSNWKHGNNSSDTAGANRKSHYSNRSNLDGSSEHTSDGEQSTQEPIKALVIPEKASSFSIHPGRLCKDECSYCFGKFGLFDTPCHIAQMKSVERQNKILETEKHLTRDSCLCDACYRHVDRKSNTPSYTNRSFKRNSLVAPGPRQNHCHVLGCSRVSTNILRRKWIIKMRKSICQVINIDLDNPGLHSIPICDEHYAALEHLMVCAMCKRRLARNHVHYLGPESADLNAALNSEGIPLTMPDKPVVCKLCKCFASVVLKDPEERPENSISFFNEYKKRLLHFNDIEPMDEAAAEEPIVIPSKAEKETGKKKRKLSRHEATSDTSNNAEEEIKPKTEQKSRVPSIDSNNSLNSQSRSGSPSDFGGVDYNTLIPAIAMDCDSDNEQKIDQRFEHSISKEVVLSKKISPLQERLEGRLSSVKEAVEISKTIKQKSDKSEVAVQKLGSNPSISVRQLFQGEEELPLHANIEFNNVKEITKEGWEKCTSTIQYDKDTKNLWSELQKPYGNQSSFLRHLILLEKYFRNGDLVLSPRASHYAANYSESVNNRLRAYDNIPSHAGSIQPITMIPFNRPQKSTSGIITSSNLMNNSAITISSNNAISVTSNNAVSIHSNNPVSIHNNNPVSIHSNNPVSMHSNNTVSIHSNPVSIHSKNPLTNYGSNPVSIHSNSNVPKSTPITLSQLNSPPLLPPNVLLQTSIKAKPVAVPPGLVSLHNPPIRPAAPQINKPPQSQKIKFPITKNWRPNLIPIDPNKKPTEKKQGLVQVISGGKPYHITLEDYKKMCAIKRSFELKQKKLQESVKPPSQQYSSQLNQHLNQQLNQHPPVQQKQPMQMNQSSLLKPITPKKKVLVTHSRMDHEPSEGESILEKLDKQVKKLDGVEKVPLNLPKIPKSLTVIPQTVSKKTRPPSPVLIITPKHSSNASS